VGQGDERRANRPSPWRPPHHLDDDLEPAGTAFGSNGVATWSITGEAKSYETVAKVIESVQQLAQVDSVLVTKASYTEDKDSGEKIVSFILSARMNDKAIRPYLKAGN